MMRRAGNWRPIWRKSFLAGLVLLHLAATLLFAYTLSYWFRARNRAHVNPPNGFQEDTAYIWYGQALGDVQITNALGLRAFYGTICLEFSLVEAPSEYGQHPAGFYHKQYYYSLAFFAHHNVGCFAVRRPPKYTHIPFRRNTYVQAPLWFVMATTGLFSGLSLFLLMRRFRLARQWQPGTCKHCGYDLRAHKPGDRCPECGTPVPATTT